MLFNDVLDPNVYVYDPQGDPISLSMTGPAWLTLTQAGGAGTVAALSGIPGLSDTGVFTITANDGVNTRDATLSVNIFEGNSPDINGDGSVNIADFSFIATHWLDACSVSDWCQGADLDANESVGPDDVDILIGSWLGL